jgi:hypothetical protein
MNPLFPAERLGKADGVIAGALLAVCFFLFFHYDIWGVGWDSLNYLFGSPLEFYDNCKRIRGGGRDMLGTPYPPPTYLVFAIWLWPLKILGLLTSPDSLSYYLTYWLKVLTTVVYFASGAVFYRVALEYSNNREWAKCATAAWLSTPLALFSQFIFSQYDIFHVILAMSGFLMFLRRKLLWASIAFGFAITFKYFPAFAFIPLLLLYEKRIGRIIFYCAVFAVPTLLIYLLYGQSSAFTEGVRNHGAIDWVFSVATDVGYWKLYLLFALFTILCGFAYVTDLSEELRTRTSAFFWLASSILPFTMVFWHPQWLITVTPSVVLTSMLSRKPERYAILDLAGMVAFVATVSLGYQLNVDAALFRADLLSFHFENSYLMAELFDWFNGHSVGVFYSAFWAYLILQIVIKYELLLKRSFNIRLERFDYFSIRQSFYVGILIFVFPVIIVVCIDIKRNEYFINNDVSGTQFGEISEKQVFEQTFVSTGIEIKRIYVFISTFGRRNTGELSAQIVSENGESLGTVTADVSTFQNNGWTEFVFPSVPVLIGSHYKIRLTAPNAKTGNAVTWWASADDSYKQGEAIVNGLPQASDFAFRVGFGTRELRSAGR